MGIRRWLLALNAAMLTIMAVPVNAVEITKQGNGGLRVAGKTYTARIDQDGNFRSLTIAGIELLDSAEPNKGGAFPDGKPAATVESQANAVTARRDGVRVQYTFDGSGFGVLTEGGTGEWRLAKSVLACVTRDGQAVPPTTAAGDVAKVAAGRAAFSLSQPYHIMWGKLMPSHLTRGGKPTDRFECRWECGVGFDPVELLSVQSIGEAGTKAGQTPWIAAGRTPQVQMTLKNLGDTAAEAAVRFRALDHHTKPKTVFEKLLPLALGAGQSQTVAVGVPLGTPGLYWVKAEVLKAEKTLKTAQLGVIYDADHYRPALTRPEDFRAFWDAKLRALRAVPFDEKLTESPQASNERFIHYELEITVAKGKRIRTFLRVPRRAGPHDAEVLSHWGSLGPDAVLAELSKLEKQPAGVGMWQRGADRIRLGAPQPEDSTYSRWAGRDDNNLLESYLLNVRMADYLRSRPTVQRIWLFGASRSGASMLAAAAFSPERVAAVNVHVPTCCGLSWQERPYRGWGRPPAETPEGLKTAAYFDPVNLAADLTVPLVMDGGFYDGLAPAPGILAFYNWAEKAPFRRCAIELGGHGFFPPGNRQRMERELAEHLEALANTRRQ